MSGSRPIGDANDYAARLCMSHIRRAVPGFDPLKRHGCGATGCVYAAGEGKVAKVTWSAEDAAVAVEIMRLGIQRPPELPRILGVYRLRGDAPCVRKAMAKCPDGADFPEEESFYITVREDLQHLTCHARDMVQRIIDALESHGTLPWYAEAKHNRDDREWPKYAPFFWPEGFSPPGDDWRKFHVYKAASIKRAVAGLHPDDQKIIAAYIRLRRWGIRVGWIFGDVRVPNLGLREATGEVVLRDFGETRKSLRKHSWTNFLRRYGDDDEREPDPGETIDGLRRRRR